MRHRPRLLVALASLLAGCVTYHPVPPTRAEIVEAVEPGDTVRLRLVGADDEVVVRVSSFGEETLRGRTRRTPAAELTGFCFAAIEHIEVARPNLPKTILVTVLPALVAAAILCNEQACRAHTNVRGSH